MFVGNIGYLTAAVGRSVAQDESQSLGRFSSGDGPRQTPKERHSTAKHGIEVVSQVREKLPQYMYKFV